MKPVGQNVIKFSALFAYISSVEIEIIAFNTKEKQQQKILL
jgi:hypothetical protein